ncbi:amidohydrolase family protein [Psychrobacter frigidicola]|uniref:Amidohydrolase family protein n=1 Tax=Psychrobacter frigidicola TaxID=45611 RepID=A0A5C7A2U7_9GAMM|nr:amidohydrolase [Psychrobacter frigidicola]TXD97917.1 amidohydrolase family protein [Psychrobacter frigidicola]
MSKQELLLRNVRLETGFVRDKNNQVIATKTALFDMHITNGKIKTINAKGQLKNTTQHNNENDTQKVKTIDANGLLMLPTFQDMHVHIDKTYYGGDWQAAPWTGDIKHMIRLEEDLIPKLLPDSQRRAEACIQLLQSYGSTFARCHCNIDPVSGLRSLEHLQLALDKYKDSFTWEIAAFPQHGILYSQSEGLLREAAQMDIGFIGGLDPTIVDDDMKKSLDVMFDIALDYDKGVDIHLHEGLPSGKAVMKHMIQRVKESPSLQGKTFITHAYALAMLPEIELEDIAVQFAEYGIGIISSIPIGSNALPIPTLTKHQVNVRAGTDNIMDNFSPFGSGDMLQKANVCAQLYGWTDEYRLNRALKMITDQPLPLDDQGKQVWPLVGDDADFILVKASCSAEAVARLPKREAVYYKGNSIY